MYWPGGEFFLEVLHDTFSGVDSCKCKFTSETCSNEVLIKENAPLNLCCFLGG